MTIKNATVESRLMELRTQKFFYDDEGKLLPGIFRTYSDESDTAAFFYRDNGQWVPVEYTQSISSYTVVTIEESLPEDALNGTYCMVRFRNSEAYPMMIPFALNTPMNSTQVTCVDDEGNVIPKTNGNLYEFVGDFILSADTETESGKIVFCYVFGGHYNCMRFSNGSEYYYVFDSYIEGTGLVYREKYLYYPAMSGNTVLDGKDVTVYYDYIDFEKSKVNVHSDVYNMDRECNLSSVDIPANAIWIPTESDCGTEYLVDKTPLIKPEFLLGFNSEVIIDANTIELSRGNASAFESHYKLMECNSLEDLQNYGNNYFNI
jgi:hypothetical protein